MLFPWSKRVLRDVKLPIQTGRVPVRLFLLKSSDDNGCTSQRKDGKVPLREFARMCKEFSEINLLKQGGRVLLREFSLKSSEDKVDTSQRKEGKLSLSEVCRMRKEVNLERVLIEGGTASILFPDKEREERLPKVSSREVGSSVNLLNPNFRLVREEEEAVSPLNEFWDSVR
jgi:hypothetical protein